MAQLREIDNRSKSDLENVPIDNLQAFYKKYYQPDNAVLMVPGKVDEGKTLALIAESFGKIPRPSASWIRPIRSNRHRMANAT